MRIYAFANQKGGVGKTTLSLHMAMFCQSVGFKTLFVDLDQQGTATFSLTNKPQFHHKLAGTSLDLWNPTAELAVETSEILQGVDFLSASAGLDRVDDDMNAGVAAIKSLRTRLPEYDVVVIDCPPAPGPRQLAPLLNADVHVVPVTPDKYGTQGVSTTLQVHKAKISQVNPGLRLQIVVNKLKANSQSNKEVARILQERLGPLVCPEWLYEREDVKRALNIGKPYWEVCKDEQADVWHDLFDRLADGITCQAESLPEEEPEGFVEEDYA